MSCEFTNRVQNGGTAPRSVEPDGTFVPGKVDVDAGWVPSMVIDSVSHESS